jgi:hypothetical protein
VVVTVAGRDGGAVVGWGSAIQAPGICTVAASWGCAETRRGVVPPARAGLAGARSQEPTWDSNPEPSASKAPNPVRVDHGFY